MSKGKKQHQEEEEHKLESAGGMRWLLTYADMITLLLGLFIILVCAAKTDTGKWNNIAAQASRVFGAGQSAINEGSGTKPLQGGGGILPYPKPPKKQGSGNDVASVTENSMGTLITFKSGMVFSAGDAAVKEDAKKELDKICSEQLAKYPNNIIVVSGHTDDRPISTGSYPSNWELSTGRAGSVARYLMDHCAINPSRIITSGRADTVPVGPNDSEEGRAKNRRVEMQVLKGEANSVMKDMNKVSKEQEPKNQEAQPGKENTQNAPEPVDTEAEPNPPGQH